MKNNWYLIIDFPFSNTKEHYNIIEILMDKNSKVLFMKDKLFFHESDKDFQEETIEEYFSFYMEDSIGKYEKDCVDYEIKILLYNEYGKNMFGTRENIKESLLSRLKNKTLILDGKILDRIKRLIALTLYSIWEKNSVYKKGKLRFVEKEDVSFNNYMGNRIGETTKEDRSWYEMNDKDMLLEAIQESNLYNAIITKDISNFMNYDYYLNMIEDSIFVLGIYDNKECV